MTNQPKQRGGLRANAGRKPGSGTLALGVIRSEDRVTYNRRHRLLANLRKQLVDHGTATAQTKHTGDADAVIVQLWREGAEVRRVENSGRVRILAKMPD